MLNFGEKKKRTRTRFVLLSKLSLLFQFTWSSCLICEPIMNVLLLLSLIGVTSSFQRSTVRFVARVGHTNYIINQRVSALAAVIDDEDDDRPKLQMAEENDGPKVDVLSLEDAIELKNPLSFTSEPPPSKSGSTSSSTLRPSQLLTEDTTIETSVKSPFGSLTLDELVVAREERARKRIAAGGQLFERSDMNGIEPQTPFLFSFVAALMSYGAWQISTYMAGHFAVQFLDSELYPVQRLAVVSRNIIVGIFTLFAGFSGAITLGLVMLGVAVTIGVSKGELDPTKKKEPNEEDETWRY